LDLTIWIPSVTLLISCFLESLRYWSAIVACAEPFCAVIVSPLKLSAVLYLSTSSLLTTTTCSESSKYASVKSTDFFLSSYG